MEIARQDGGQGLLGFVEANRKSGQHITGYEYAVLVTNLDYGILALGQLSGTGRTPKTRSRSGRTNGGWCGFATHDLHRWQLSARAVALIYNGGSLFARLANPGVRREAITSRPWLMSAIGRRTEHAGQTTITINSMHAHFKKARQALNVG